MAAKRAVVALAIAALAAVCAPAAASPEITIRAHTQLTFDGMRRSYGGELTATGKLQDQITGAGIENQRITLEIGGRQFETVTDRDGSFAVELPALTGAQDLQLRFIGGDLLDPSDLALQAIEVDKQAVELGLVATAIDGGVQVALTATSAGNPVAIRATIKAGPADVEPGKLPVVGELTSGSTLNVMRAQAGGAGRRRVVATFAGDQVFAAGEASTTFELKTTTKTTFVLAAKSVSYEDRVTGTGKVVDEDGEGLARAPVTLLTGDRRLEQTSTRADGTFSFSLEAELLGEGSHALQAVVDTSSPFLSPSRSDPPVVVKIAAPQPVPIAFTAAAFAATALVAGGFFLLRSRPWDKRKRAPLPAERPAGTDDKGEVKGGLTQARPGLVSTLRRAADLGVSGSVRDAVRGRPIAGATVRLRTAASPGGAPAEHVAVTAEDGGFAVEDLAPGEWTAKVFARGHVSERFTLTVPHRGELRGVRVDLVPVREQVFSLYKVAAQPQLPEPRLWGVWSPRQIVDHVRKQRPSPALAELTDFVEEAYFSARVPDEDVLPSAQARVDRAVHERAPRTAAV